MTNALDWTLTLIALAAGFGLFAWSNHKADQPADPLKPRLIPWRFMIVLSGFFILLVFVHMANLIGVETGPDKSPFGRM